MKKPVRTWQELPLVEVVWVDACIDPHHEGQLDDEASTKAFGGLILCSDVGYLIEKTRKEIKLAVSICRDDGTYRHSNTIPRGWVKAINLLHRPDDQPADPDPADRVPGSGDRAGG